jgi:hypothetical protein
MLKPADEFVFRKDHSNLLFSERPISEERIPYNRRAFGQPHDHAHGIAAPMSDYRMPRARFFSLVLISSSKVSRRWK